MFNTEKILNDYKLFWQYPAITEKTFYNQNKYNNQFLGFPWATIIDKKYDNKIIYNLLKQYTKPGTEYYTCCQHISFRKLIPLWKSLNIKTVFISHKLLNEDSINNILLKPCPLFAVNVETVNFSKHIFNKDLLNNERKILYNFIGGYQPGYLTKIRLNIFKMDHPENTLIKFTGDWHFNKLVYHKKQNFNEELNLNDEHNKKTKYYNEILLDSRYTLAPSGSGPNSIRFWEALGAGSIPILLSDTLELPEHKLWDHAIIKLNENKIENLPTILNNISLKQEKEMRMNCLKIYKYFKNNYKNQNLDDNSIIPKVLFTSYKINSNDRVVQKILSKWKKLNPTYSIKYFSDKDVFEFFKESKYFDTFIKMKNGVAIADFFRINYIQKYGGYWFDFDLEPIKVELPTFGKIHLFDSGYKNISYMFIGGAPNQKLFEDIIIKVNNNIINNLKKKTQHVLEITGPRIIQSIIMPKLNKLNYNDGVLEAGKNPEIFLKNSQYEFVYQRIYFTNTKTEEYKLLQAQNNQKPYQYYNFI